LPNAASAPSFLEAILTEWILEKMGFGRFFRLPFPSIRMSRMQKNVSHVTKVIGLSLAAVAMTQGQEFSFLKDDASKAAPAAASSSSAGGHAAPRTGAYGAVMKGNAAADNTVDDYTLRPHLIGSKQYLAGWGTGDLNNGAFSFEGAGFNWFGSVLGGDDPDDIRVGMASGEMFGAGLFLSLAKEKTEAGGIETEVTFESDGYGLFGSFNLGGSDVYGEAILYTGFQDLNSGDDHYTHVSGPGGDAEENNSIIHLRGGWKKDSEGEGSHALNPDLTINLHSNDADSVIDRSGTEMDFWFHHGIPLSVKNGFSVFAGSSTQFYLLNLTDEVADVDIGHTAIAVTPNISFQKSLPKGLEFFSGAAVTIRYDSYENFDFGGAGGAPEEASSWLTTGADVSIGLRWAYENLAIEGSVKDGFLLNGPHFLGGTVGQGIFATGGLSVVF
jgi:hypothetical protein